MGLRLRGRSEQRGSYSREVSRNQAGRGLSGVPRPHGKGYPLASTKCAGEHWNADHRVVCDVAWIEREWPLLRPPGIAIFQSWQNRSRPGRRLQRTQENERGRDRAMAWSKLELRRCGVATGTVAKRWSSGSSCKV